MIDEDGCTERRPGHEVKPCRCYFDCGNTDATGNTVESAEWGHQRQLTRPVSTSVQVARFPNDRPPTRPERRTMRILYLIDSLAPGGAETSLVALAPHLIAGGVELEVGYFVDRPGLQQQLRTAGARVTLLGNEGGRRSRVARVRTLVVDRRPQLVHTTLFEADVAGRVGARLARTPVVTSLVSDAYGRSHRDADQLGWRLRAAHGLDALTAQLARRFHANSELVATNMSRRLGVPRSRIDVVVRGRDATAFAARPAERRAQVRASLRLTDQPMVLAVGRQEPAKGLDVLIKAVPALRAAMPELRVLIAGREGAHSSHLRQLVDNHCLSDVVTFLGQRDDVADLLSAADVLAFPSLREGFPGTLVEALAVGCPIVATDHPNVREAVGDCAAALVRANDPGDLADGLRRAIQYPDRARQLVLLGQRRFESMFTIEQSAAGMLAFYERSLRHSRP